MSISSKDIPPKVEIALSISSADFMTRNIDGRVEVTCPIYDERIKNELMLFERPNYIMKYTVNERNI